MQPGHPHMVGDRLIMMLAVVILAGSITFLEVAFKPSSQINDLLKTGSTPVPAENTPQASPSPSPKPSPTPAATPVPAVAAPTPTPAPKPSVRTATTVSFVHFRSGKTTASPIIMDLDGGVVVELRNDSNATWQGVRYKGYNGYIYKSYLQYN